MFNPKRVQEIFIFYYIYVLIFNTQKYNITKHHINVCIIHKMNTRTNFCSIINIFRGSVKSKNNTKLQRNNIVEIKTLLGAKKEKKQNKI